MSLPLVSTYLAIQFRQTQIVIYVLLFRKKKKEEARKAELAFSAEAEDDCSAQPKCKRPTGKQVSFRPNQTLILRDYEY